MGETHYAAVDIQIVGVRSEAEMQQDQRILAHSMWPTIPQWRQSLKKLRARRNRMQSLG